MASPNSTFTELVTTTFRKHDKEIRDNVSQHNALLKRLMAKGKIRVEDGGLSIVTPLEYAENGTYQRYSGFDNLNIQAADVLSAAEYAWKQVAVHVAASGLELRTNSGEQRIINMARAKVKNAINSFKNGLASDVYSDGTSSNQINGLQALVADAGTGTVGGINSSTYTFWQNKVQSAAAPRQGGAGITPGKDTIESLMLPLWLALTRGDDAPDLIVMDDTYFTYFEQSQTSIKRYNDASSADAGFVSLKYKGADVIYDGNTSMPDAHAYFLNTDYLEMVAHRDANMTVMDEKTSVNQDAVVIPILWQGNLVCSNRALQGVMKA